MPLPSPDEYLRRQALLPIARSSAEWDLVAAQLKERAFFMAGVQRANILQLFRNMAAKVAAGYMTPAEARVAIRAGLADLGYSPESEGAAPGSIHDLSSYRRIMLVLETNVRMAAGWMQHLQRLSDPNVGAQELFRLYARKVPRNWALRWAEAAQKVNWQGVAQGAPFIATLDSPIWPALSRFGNPYPPFDFNSGMSTRPVLIDRCRELGLPPTKPASPPSLNEHMQASLASLDADLADALARSLGALAQRQGDALVMTDLNGSKKYPLQTLCRLFAAALPAGVPSLQAKAASAWAIDTDSLLPGGKNAALLPALIAFAGRITPRPPAKLEQFLQKAEAAQKKTGTSPKNGIQSTTTPHGRRDSQTAQRGQDSRIQRERGIHPLDITEREGGDEQGLRRRVYVSQGYGLIAQAVPGAAEAEILKTAQITAAQLNATFDGTKPAFIESIPGYSAALAKDLPPGVRFVEAGGIECIYNEAAIAKELNLPEGTDVEAIVREKLEQGSYGKLLGYGMDTMLERPCTYVSIKEGEKEIFGFMAPADNQEALKYATARLRDFQKEFPDKQWSFNLRFLP